jgi:hypothetical protein
MNTAVAITVGVLIGGTVVGGIAAVIFINSKLTLILNILHALSGKVLKIEKVTEATMSAAETFVEALRQSSRDMHMPMGNMGNMENPDDFQDLRDTFEDGIRNFEEEPEDDEENWKK